MSQDQLRSAIDAIRTQLQAELEAQLETVDRVQHEAVEAARRAADAEAHERWAVQLEQVRADWASRLETELAAAAAEADRRTVAECTRARLETEQTAAESIAQIKQQSAADIERARGEFLAARADADAARAEAGKARADAETIQADLEKARAEAAEARADLERVQADAADARAALDTMRAEAERAEAELETVGAALEKTRADAQASIGDERARTEGALAAAHARIEALERDRAQDGERAAVLESELAGLRTQMELERNGLTAALQAERERVGRMSGELLDARSALERERSGARDLAQSPPPAPLVNAADARVSERQSQLAIVERLLDSVHAMSRAQSLTDVLAALVAGAAAEVPRAAMFIVNGDALQGFKASGFDESAVASRGPAHGQGALAEAIATRIAVPVSSANSPAFAALPADRAGLAVPIGVGGRAVAVLYADDVSEGEPAAPASWPEAVQILCAHAAAALSHLTALRTTQAMRLRAAGPQAGSRGQASEDDQAARRYARLLVSEIKLYNEAAVRLGREKRDLLLRLRPELERARRLYDERVPAGVAARGVYFQQELVQTLADGDPSLLGNPAVHS